jgi:hypothetical protein
LRVALTVSVQIPVLRFTCQERDMRIVSRYLGLRAVVLPRVGLVPVAAIGGLLLCARSLVSEICGNVPNFDQYISKIGSRRRSVHNDGLS